MSDHSEKELLVGKNLQPDALLKELAEARQRIAALEAVDAERESIARALRLRTHELGERIKELNCLYRISHLVEQPGVSLEEILQGTADLIPPAWQYPEIAAARITLEGQGFRTANFAENAAWQQTADILAHGQRCGTVAVCYLEERPECDEGPFLKEERSLLNAIAERLGRIAERMRVEQALEESEEKHRTLFETMAQGVVYQDASGRITAANPAAERILGLTLDQMQGRTSMDPRWRAIHEDGSDFPGDTHPSMVALKTGKEVHNVVMGVYNPQMETYNWININAVPQFRTREDKPYRVYTTFEDITEQVRATHALQEERDRAQKYLDISGVILVVIAPDQTVTLINREGCQILGYREKEILGRNWFDRFVPRRQREQVKAEFERLMAGQIAPIEHFENPVVTRDGEERIIAWHNTVLRDAAGNITGTLSSGEDVTERVRAEQALRQARDELEQRVRERTTELEQGRQRESVLNALLRLSMEETTLQAQLQRALDEILAIPWLPVLRQGAIFLATDTTSGDPGLLELHAHRGLSPAFETACARIQFGRCLCGRAAASGEIEFADRVDERHAILYQGIEPHGHYCVPIVSGEKVTGTLVLYLKEGHRRDLQEEEFLRAVAHTLAGMLERKRTEDALRQSEQRLRELNKQLEEYSRTLEQRVTERTREIERRGQVAESLRDILTVLNSDRPLGEILDYIVAEASRLLRSDASAIYRLRGPDEGFNVQTAISRSDEWAADTEFPPELAQALLDGQPVVVSDAVAALADDLASGFLRVAPAKCLTEGCHALLAVPLLIANEVYGALVLYYAQPRAFSADEGGLAVAFADQAALAIENARLHQQAMEAAVVEERARLARELHDSVTQSLYSLTLLAEGWRRLARAGRLEDTEDPLSELGDLAQQALKEMRLMVYELRPPALEQEGLLGALHQRLGAVEQRAGVEARLVAEDIVELPAPVEEGLYRIAIEALNNALKHAAATSVTVRLYADEGRAQLQVTDNGCGFDVDAMDESPGMGLHSMRERAEKLGGSLTIHSSPGEGTRVVANVPFGE